MRNILKMNNWGPYSKKYMGISNIIKSLKDVGGRFDFIVHPTLWNSSIPVPNVTIPSNYHLWQCNTDYSFYSYRYELMFKDKVYCDISFSQINDGTHLVRCEFVNNTNLSQNCILNTFGALEFPFFEYIKINGNGKYKIINANDYLEYTYTVARPWDNENPDGMFKGMFRDKNFYCATGLGDRCDNKHTHFLNLKPFGCEKGDKVSYSINADEFENPILAIRYKTVTDGDGEFLLNNNKIVLKNTNQLAIAYLPYCDNPVFESLGKAGIEIDFLAVCEKNVILSAELCNYDYIPNITSCNCGEGKKVQLDYNYRDTKYTILTHNKNTRQRTLNSGCLEDALINRLSNGDHTYDDLTETFSNSFARKNSDKGCFSNTLIKSIFVKPNSNHIEYIIISDKDFSPLTNDDYEQIYINAKNKEINIPLNKKGEKYTLTTNILKSTLLTNAVYPVYRHGENVIHHTPGKRWDSFYTWDSGFIGMGLLEYSNELCKYVLDMYLCDESNKDFAFLLHGSLVPTQFVEYLELLKRTNDKHSLDFMYDKLRLYYEFLQGRAHNSTCGKFNNGLLTTYDYWYSCSGMDDYPAQVEMIKNKAEEYSCPCLPTSQIILAGKILKMVSDFLGKSEDVEIYDKDIEYSTKALNKYCWHNSSGYYGYTMYDKDKNKPYIMTTADGENWNKGFDGIYPLIAGAVDDECKKKILINHIKNPKEMWSNAGVSAVDMTSSYYFEDGYWNGNVWMSHQWFVFKSMLDNGENDFAYEIANRAIEMFSQETDFTYNTYECFGIQTKRGGWFHNFGGLSSPICIWVNAYYRPNTVTTGFDVWTDYQHCNNDSAEISFKYYGNNNYYSMIVTLNDSYDYTAALNDKKVEFKQRVKGCLEFTFDKNIKSGIIKIQKL